MKVYLLIGLNIFLISFITYFLIDHKHQMVPFKGESICLKTSSTAKLCVQCFKRDEKLHHNRGFRIQSKQEITLLKIADQQTFLTCYDYLQFINNHKESQHNKQISLQLLPSLSQILTEINAVTENKQMIDEVIQPWYHQFVIYKREDASSKQITVTFPNPQTYKTIHFGFLVGFHFTLLFVSLFLFAGNSFLAKQSTQIRIFMGLILILFEMYLLEVKGQFCLYLCRILVLNIGFIRLRVSIPKVMVFLTAGLFSAYYQLTLLIYVVFILFLVMTYGRNQQGSKDVKDYLLCLYMVLLFNHLYIYQFSLFLNDFTNLAIDLWLIITIPLGLLIFPDPKQPYHPIEQNPKANSLNEQQFSQPTTI